jgi:hypothetical protein
MNECQNLNILNINYISNFSNIFEDFNNFNSIMLQSLLETKIVFKDQIFDLFEKIGTKIIKITKKCFNTKTLFFLFLPIKFIVRFPSHCY